MSPRKARPSKPQPSENQPSTSDRSPVLQRINKVLAAAGLGSRRQVDELIEQGRVEINGQVITQVGVKVDLANDSISVDNELLKKHRPVYFALHKPEGVLCTNRDPQGRPRVIDFVPNQHRLFPVGRLDASSTGLILLTNDGELAQQLAHPKHEIPKRYAVVVVGQVELDALKRLERGIYLAEGKAQVDHAKLKKVRKTSTELEITLSEGKNREIRRVLARLGHKVVSLKRIAIGPLKLADLPEGAYRPLSNQEVQGLYQAVDDIRRERKAARKARKKLASAAEESQNPAESLPKAKPPKLGKSSKAGGKPWEKLPSLNENPYATDEDIDDASIEDQDDELILIRDQGPGAGAVDDPDDEYLFIPRKRTGSVIGQEEDQDLLSDDSDGMGLELFDSDEEEFDEPSPSDSKPRPRKGASRGPRAAGQKKRASQKNYTQRSSGSQGSRPGRNRDGAKSDGMRRDGIKSGESSGYAPKRGGPKRNGPNQGGPKRGGPKRGGPKRGGPMSGGPKGGGPKPGGPKRGGPKRSGPKPGGGRSGRGQRP